MDAANDHNYWDSPEQITQQLDLFETHSDKKLAFNKRSAVWKKQVEMNAGGFCEHCGCVPINPNVHHTTYARYGWEFPSDGMFLCRKCHARVHDQLA